MLLKRIVPFVFALAFVLVVVLVNANDDQGNPNDPNTNERANACYEDGSMAGKCDTEWAWNCGWYLIRYENGLISTMPETCVILIDGGEPALTESPLVELPIVTEAP